jgi:hypothetical protein
MESISLRRLFAAIVAGLLLAGCTATGAVTGATEETGGSPAAGEADSTGAFAFPTGRAVTVPAGYEPPTDRVDSTGGYLPVNGKPTLVFAESIT